MDATQYPALKTFLLADSLNYGFAPLIAQGEPGYLAIAAALNKVRDGTDGKPIITINRANITPIEILEAVDVSDMAPAAGGLAWWNIAMVQPVLRFADAQGNKTRVRTNFDKIIQNAGAGSQARLDLLVTQPASYATKQGWGKVETWDVGRALTG